MFPPNNGNGNGNPNWPPQPQQPWGNAPQQQPQQPQQQPPWAGQQPQQPPMYGQSPPGFSGPNQGAFGMVPVQQGQSPLAPYGRGPQTPQTFFARFPRLAGLLLTGAGGGLVFWMQSMIESEGRYYPKALFFGCIAVFLGIWTTITGQPKDPQTGQPANWWRIASGIVFFISLIAGGLLAYTIAHPEL